MNWEQLASDFAWDGAWRDIYVLNTSEADWQAIWDILREWTPPAIFQVSDEIAPMPSSVKTALESPSLLTFYVGPIEFACHFFGAHEIEFDFDPRQVSGKAEADVLGRFMRLLGDATGKQVLLTHENFQDAVIARYSSDSESVIWTALS